MSINKKYLDDLKLLHPILWNGLVNHRTHKGTPLTFENKSYLKDIYLDRAQKMVLKKSTQSGVSEYALCRLIQKCAMGRSIFYVLPTDMVMVRYVRNRVDKSVSFSEYYKSLIETSTGDSNAVHLKHIGSGAAAFAGSNTPNPFTEFPADEIIIDELDRCDLSNVYMAEERLSASDYREKLYISNPTITGYGIDYEYSKSDGKTWFIKCPHCNEWINPQFFVHVLRKVGSVINPDHITYDSDSDYEIIQEDDNGNPLSVCHKCHNPFNRFAPGQWVKHNQNVSVSGYDISKMFSAKDTLTELVDRFEAGTSNETKMTRFINGDLGMAYASTASSITRQLLIDSVGTHSSKDSYKRSAVMGIDVGTYFHIVIGAVLPNGNIQQIAVTKTKDWKEIRPIAIKYGVKVGVIDGLPETRISKQICNSLSSFFMCFFADVKKAFPNFADKTITVNRTMLLDTVKQYLIDGKLTVSADMINNEEYVNHMEVSRRLALPSNRSDREDIRYVWSNNNKADHYFLANAYMCLAYQIRSTVLGRKSFGK